MQKVQAKGRLRKPPIHIIDTDYDVIAELALGMEKRSPELSKTILDEIDRARIHSAAALPKDVVTLGSEVEFLDGTTGTMRRVQLVLPWNATMEADCISVMTPVGAGLIGMSVGREISWPCPDGRPRILKILEVRQQP